MVLSLVAVGEVAMAAHEPRTRRQPNVLFIAVADLNHWVGCLGRNPQTRPPNLDRLAKRGRWFTRSDCVAPTSCQYQDPLPGGLPSAEY